MSRATAINWPSMTDYQEAVQAPRLCFQDAELQAGEPLLDELGLPRPVCGQFATVYAIETPSHCWAVKCFLRNVPDLQERYTRIAEHLAAHPSPLFMSFEMLPEGILVRGQRYPLLRMEWVRGLMLNHFVERWLKEPAVLEALGDAWDDLLSDLRGHEVAHGDLQHGNVIVDADGTLRLVDYDGMWVPALDGTASFEMGHPNYQSPERSGDDFDASIDRFAGEAIAVALRALTIEPDLWQTYDNGDNLLFRRSDFADPARSALVGDLGGIADDPLQRRLDRLLDACHTTAPALPAAPPAAKPPATVRPARRRTVAKPARRRIVRAPATVAVVLGQLRVLLHLVGLWPALAVAVIGGAACLTGDADWTMAVAAPAFGIAAGLGLASFVTLYVIRTAHAIVCSLFFGMLAAIGLVCLGAEGLVRGSFDAIVETDPTRLALIAALLAVSALAGVVEIACSRMGIVSAWRKRHS